MIFSLLSDTSTNIPLQVSLSAGVGIVLLASLCSPQWPSEKVVTQDDGTQVRYVYPVRAKGWLPILGHALKVISADGRKWMLQNFIGYNRPFYVDMMGKQIVECSGPTFRKHFVRAPDSQLSSVEGLAAFFNFDLTFGVDCLQKDFHIKVIRTSFMDLRRVLIPKVVSGLEDSLESLFPQLHTAGDSTTITPLQDVVSNMIGDMMSVILLGDELGKKPDLVKAMKELTETVNEITFSSSYMPRWMINTKNYKSIVKSIHYHIEAEIERRRRNNNDESSNSSANPNGEGPKHLDILQLLIDFKDEEEKDGYPPDVIANRMVTLIFGTFDTTATALSTLLLELCSPQNSHAKQQVLREVESVLATSTDGGDCRQLTQESVSKMTYSKACLNESQRRSDHVIGAPLRKVLKDFCVPLGKGEDGIDEIAVVPKGALLSYSPVLAHNDKQTFPSPDVFDPDRNQLGKDRMDASKSNVGFGLGRHSCPGRFFATEEIQTALVVLFRNFDLSFESDQSFEPKTSQGLPVVCDLPVKVTLKKAGETMLRKLRSEKRQEL